MGSFDCEFAASVRKVSEKKTERTTKSIVSITADTIRQLVNVVDRKVVIKPKLPQPHVSTVFETFFVNKRPSPYPFPCSFLTFNSDGSSLRLFDIRKWTLR